MNYQKYLDRIKVYKTLKPTLENLRLLQRNHLLNIPFENLDIHYDKEIIAKHSDLFYEKIIENNRGGFCYELNGLFYKLLKHIGYDVYMSSARVYNKEKGYGPDYDHMVLLVTIDNQKWITDVGFGEFTFEPLKLETELIQNDKRGVFKVEEQDNSSFVILQKLDEEWAPQYIFSINESKLEDFSEMCKVQQTSPDVHFTQRKICSLATENGRISISDTKIKITTGDKVEEIDFNSDEFEQFLYKYFRMKMY